MKIGLMYRDELTGAKKRIEDLQVQVQSQSDELLDLRAQVNKRLGATQRDSPWRYIAIAAGVGAAVASAVLWLVLRSDTVSQTAPVSVVKSPQEVDSDAPATSSSAPGPTYNHPRSSSTDPGFRIPVVDAGRVAQLASSCPRTIDRTSMEALPPGTRSPTSKRAQDAIVAVLTGRFHRRLETTTSPS